VGASLRGMLASFYVTERVRMVVLRMEVVGWWVGRGCTFSSTREKPRPARTRRLYLIPGQRTMGRSLSTGRGATATALAKRAFLRRFLRPGYVAGRDVRDWIMEIWGVEGQEGESEGQGRVGRTWSKWVRTRRCQSLRKSVFFQLVVMVAVLALLLTVVLDLLVVLDRLSSIHH